MNDRNIRAADQEGLIFLQIPIWAIIFSISIISLPFTRAFTYDIGFPVKIYEVGFSLAILFYFLGKKILPKVNLGIKNSLFIFIVVIFLSTALQIYLIDFDSGISGFRGGRALDMISRMAYLFFNCAVFIVAIRYFLYYPKFAIFFWLIGLVIAFSLHCVILFFLVFEGTQLLLPGIDALQIGEIRGLQIPRAGTFLEGNFAGFYYLSSLAISCYSRKWFFGLISFFGILLSLSTSALLGALVFLIMIGNNFISSKIYKLLFLFLLIVFCIFTYDFLDISQKFSSELGSSASMRLNEMMTGIHIFWDHPLLGVGLGGYGHVFDQFEWQLTPLKTDVLKRISNNIYIELLSETGIIGFLAFSVFYMKWLLLMKCSNGTKCFWYFGAAALIIFFAYPTFNITYLWCILGFGVGASIFKDNNNSCG